VHVRSWQAAYRGLLSQEYLDGLDLNLDEREARWRDAIAQSETSLLVAVVEGTVVGWVAYGACRDGDLASAVVVGEIWAIYLLPQYWSTGLGRALWLAAKTELRKSGFYSATLWVLADNARAIRFYRAAGFVAEGASQHITRGGAHLEELRYVADLTG
jgi:ribosomal protein S18 acetylase RimI-like enzyme